MMEYIKKLIKNINNTNYETDGYQECYQVLGNSTNLDKLATHYVDNKENIELIRAFLILGYADNGNFTKEEYSAYKQGISDFIQFYHNTHLEIERSRNRQNIDKMV